MVGAASRDRSGAYNGGVHLEPPVSFLQDLLPATSVAPAVSEPEAGPDWFDQLTGGLGNAGFGELVCNNLTPPATTEQETSPVQRKIDEITARKGGFSNYPPPSTTSGARPAPTRPSAGTAAASGATCSPWATRRPRA